MWKNSRIVDFLIRIFLGGTLAKRFILYLFIGIIIPISFVIYFNYTSVLHKMVEQYAQHDINNITYLLKIFDNYYRELNDLSLSIYSDSDINNAIHGEQTEDTELNAKLYNKTKDLFYNRNDIEELRLFTKFNNRLIVFNKGRDLSGTPGASTEIINNSDIPRKIPFYDELDRNNKQYFSSISTDSNSKSFIFNQLVMDYSNTKKISVLSMKIDPTFLDQQSEELVTKDGGAVFLLDVNYREVYQSQEKVVDLGFIDQLKNSEFLNKDGYLFLDIDQESKLILYCWNKNNQYLMLKIIPVKYLYEGIKPSLVKSVITGILLIFVFIIIIIIISKSISKPIRKLVEHMKKIKDGKFDVRVNYKTYNSEAALLIEKFNLMVEEINRLFNEKYKMQIAQKTAELSALQAQVNPHFLYNTLQTVQYMALKRHAYEIESVITALGDILKYSLKNSSSIVTLSEELEYVNKYFIIQRFKFLNSLEVNIEFNEEVGSLMIPKMIIQPFIENSFIHGYYTSDKKFIINIHCYKEEECIVIEIIDNGKGIEKEVLDRLQTEINGQEEGVDLSGEAIGIKNVSCRLEILYKNRASIKINSVPYEKTSFTIRIPSKMEGLL